MGAMRFGGCLGEWSFASRIPPPAVLSAMLNLLVGDPILIGLLTAGVLAAIMSSLDSQFLCLGTIFTNDIVIHRAGADKYSDKQIIFIARCFIVGIVALTYGLAMLAKNANVFDLAIWCFSGFSALFPSNFCRSLLEANNQAGCDCQCYCSTCNLAFITFTSPATVGNTWWVLVLSLLQSVLLPAAVVLILVSLTTEPPSKETLDKFFPKKSEL